MVLSLANSAAAWSSAASRTQSDLRELAAAFEVYKSEAGHYPDPKRYWLELKGKDLWYQRDPSAPKKDRWERPVIYRLPRKQSDFDLYSVGPDGVDNGGAHDDVSLTGVNDGFHWKATWPAGRLALQLGILAAVLACALRFVWPWRLVGPIAGMILCAGTMIGCRLLMHPGVVNDRNQPLRMYIFLAAVVFGVLLCRSMVFILKRHFSRKRPSALRAGTWST